MSEITNINKTLEASDSCKAVTMPDLTDSPVMATALITGIPATFGSGNIGRLIINTVANRLLAAGADPRYVSATVTIDDDTAKEIIEAVTLGMRDAAVDAEMEWAAVEAKAIATGPSTGIAISAFGVGQRMASATAEFRTPKAGDDIIITGPAGATGAAIKASEENVELLTQSDGAVLTDVMRAVYAHTPDLSAVIFPIEGIEKALEAAGIEADIHPAAVPVDDAVLAACSTLGLNPLNIMTSDAMLLVVNPADTEKVLEAVRRYPAGAQAAVIGKVER